MPKIKSLKIQTPPLSGLEIKDIPESARLVVLTGPNGSGKTTILHSLVHAAQNHVGRSGSNPQAKAEFYNAQAGVPVDVYLRTPYRTEHALSLGTPQAIAQMHAQLDTKANRHPKLSSGPDHRLNSNFAMILKRVYDAAMDTSNTWDSAMNEWVDPINNRITSLFPGLAIVPMPRPLASSPPVEYIRFTKDGTTHPHSGLSSGEKDVLDLIIDLHLVAGEYQDSIFCIDEPELHIHLALQGSVAQHIFDLVPTNGQLWIATHSVGILHKAMELLRSNPDEVVFIDLSSVKPSQVISPSAPNKTLWRSVLHVALGELSGLVSPKQIVICEGEPRIAPPSAGKKPKNTEFDAQAYNTIFADSHPDTIFISAGSSGDVKKDTIKLQLALGSLVPAADIVRLIDMDNRSQSEIDGALRNGVRVLSRYSIDSFLWSDEIIKRMIGKYGCTVEQESKIIEAKTRALGRSVGSAESPHECVKDIDHLIYEECKKVAGIRGRGNDRKVFAKEVLASLITPETKTFSALERDIFG